MRRILVEAHQQVTALLAEHRDELDGLAHALLEHETLDGPAAYAAVGGHSREARSACCRSTPCDALPETI